MMPDSSGPRISVVIPQWGQFQLTANLMEQLLRHESYRSEFVVVDDGSPDYERCPVAANPRVRFVHQDHQGVTAAWNRGASNAGGEFLVFLNNDVKVQGSFLSALVRPLKDERIVMTGCRRRLERAVPHSEALMFPRALLEGWCFAVRRIDFEALGGFDERFRLYFSDTDLQWRLLAAKTYARLEVVSDLPLSHLGHVSTRCDPERRVWHANDRRAFLQKWRSA